MSNIINVFFATNRNQHHASREQKEIYKTGIAFGAKLSGYDGKALRFGKAEIEVNDNAQATIKSITVAKENETTRSPKGKARYGSTEIYESLRKVALESKDNILFIIHGYANDFESGLIGAAEIGATQKRSNVFAFCWPSAEVAIGLNYGCARDLAEISGHAIGRSFAILLRYLNKVTKEERCNRKVDVIAHSMGNYALRHAVQSMKSELLLDTGVRLFDDLILVAADDDNDTLEHEDGIAPLIPFVRAVTVYYSRWDIALQYSDRVKCNPDRLGQYGPRNMTSISDKVVAVDVSDALDQDQGAFINHWYHRSSHTKILVDDMHRTLTYMGADAFDPEHFPNRVPVRDRGPRRYILK